MYSSFYDNGNLRIKYSKPLLECSPFLLKTLINKCIKKNIVVANNLHNVMH